MVGGCSGNTPDCDDLSSTVITGSDLLIWGNDKGKFLAVKKYSSPAFDPSLENVQLIEPGIHSSFHEFAVDIERLAEHQSNTYGLS